MLRHPTDRARPVGICSVLALTVPAILGISGARAEQPPAPCFPNSNAAADSTAVATRGDVKNLPQPMKDRLVQLADRSEIIKLGTYLQTHLELSFLQVSRLLDLKSGQCIYNETTRPDMRYGA